MRSPRKTDIAAAVVIAIAMTSDAEGVPVHYDIYFARFPQFAGDGYHSMVGVTDSYGTTLTNLTGSFDYDATTPTFSNFFVTWTHTGFVQDPPSYISHPLLVTQTDTFDLAALANSGLLGSLPAGMGLAHTPADTFRLLSHDYPSDMVFPGQGYLPTYYEVGGARRAGLGSLLGGGKMIFNAVFCLPSTCNGDGGFGAGFNDPVVVNPLYFTTTAVPYGTADPKLVLSWGGQNAYFSLSPIALVPEPTSLALFGFGLLGLAGILARSVPRPNSLII